MRVLLCFPSTVMKSIITRKCAWLYPSFLVCAPRSAISRERSSSASFWWKHPPECASWHHSRSIDRDSPLRHGSDVLSTNWITTEMPIINHKALGSWNRVGYFTLGVLIIWLWAAKLDCCSCNSCKRDGEDQRIKAKVCNSITHS